MTFYDWMSLLTISLMALCPFIMYGLVSIFLYIRKEIALTIAKKWYPDVYENYKKERCNNE